MIHKLEELAAAVGWGDVPPDLVRAAAQLTKSSWPAIVERWSRLTPSGFPIELTVTEADATLRWAAEVAGPEVDERHRLGLVAGHLAAAAQPVPAPLLHALKSMQQGHELVYGAWLSGRATPGEPARFKLYAEIPENSRYENVLPAPLQEVCARLPLGSLPRMLGVEPARNRMELYVKLPIIELENLRPVLRAAGYANGLEALECNLPDGERRLAGRRLAISFALANDAPIQVALFATARSLFPGAPEMLRKLVPAVARIPASLGSFTLVTLGLHPTDRALSFGVGVTVARA